MLLRCVRSCESAILSSRNKVSQDESANTKFIQETSKMMPNSISKSMNKTKKHARRAMQTNIANQHNCNQKDTKSKKRHEHEIQKLRRGTMHTNGNQRGGTRAFMEGGALNGWIPGFHSYRRYTCIYLPIYFYTNHSNISL